MHMLGGIPIALLQAAPAEAPATTTTSTTGPPGPQGAQASGFDALVQLLPMMVMCFLVFYFLIIRPQRKQQQAVRQMLDNLKKNDLVRFSGGILGRVVSVEKDKNIVALKLDDSGNQRIRVLRTAIEAVIVEETPAAKPEERAKQKAEVG